jgi:DNA-directed RNA polymerase alpha subunit
MDEVIKKAQSENDDLIILFKKMEPEEIKLLVISKEQKDLEKAKETKEELDQIIKTDTNNRLLLLTNELRYQSAFYWLDELTIETILNYCGMNMRTFNIFKRNGIENIKDLKEFTFEEIKNFRFVGNETIKDIERLFNTFQIKLKENKNNKRY